MEKHFWKKPVRQDALTLLYWERWQQAEDWRYHQKFYWKKWNIKSNHSF